MQTLIHVDTPRQLISNEDFSAEFNMKVSEKIGTDLGEVLAIHFTQKSR